jgi:hypothetical protein
MKKMWLYVFCLASTLTFAGSAHARGGSGILFDVNLYYSSSKSTTKTTAGVETIGTDGSTAIYDIKLGYFGNSGLYFGGIYTSRSESVLNASGTSGSAMGGSIGYFASSGIFLMAHYIASASYGFYKEGTGVQADLGYKAGVGSGWLLGGEISYRSIGYKKNENIANLDTYTVAEVVPMISIGYLF